MSTQQSSAREWIEQHQTALYLASIAAGLILGSVIAGADLLEQGINPAIALLLYVTFLGVPFTQLGRSFLDIRFLTALFVLNFVVVPAIVWALSRFVAHDTALLIGVLLVLLTPCIDYVIVFSALAGAAHERLLAAAPLLMLAQLALLPLYLWLFEGPSLLDIIDVAPFAQALLLLIVLPLIAAAITQWAAARNRAAQVVADTGATSMVPLMVLVLFIVVASQAARVTSNWSSLVAVVPIYAGFLVVMALVGAGTSRIARLDIPASRALTFSGATRNSLVVLPLALALPVGLELAPAVVVTQTLIELIGMVLYIRLIPRLISSTSTPC